jgi:hypothetical protein
MASWIVNVLVDRHSLGGEWSKQNRLLVDRHSSYEEWSRIDKSLVDRHSPCEEWSRLIDCLCTMDSYSPGALPRQVEWSGTTILLGCMSVLEEWSVSLSSQ